MESQLEKLKQCKSFAVLGGTFDPVHSGHIEMAKFILKETDIEKILFIPLRDPPHKDARNVTNACHRLNMLRLAVEGYEDFFVSEMEIKRGGKTYTIDTIKELRNIFGKGSVFYFIIGTDELHLINTWKDYEELLKICSFLAVTRPGYKDTVLASDVNMLKEKYGANIRILEIPPVDISSSEIREQIKKGVSADKYLDENVLEYIKEKGLYK